MDQASRHGFVYMTVYIHISKVKKMKLEPSEKKETFFMGYRVFHMEIDEEEQVAPPVVGKAAPPSTNS
jgi:hypothetical protein